MSNNYDNRNRRYLMQFACFECRKVFKQPVAFPWRAEAERHVCPDCGTEMSEMGRNFRAPKRTDEKAWSELAAKRAAGVTFHTSRRGG